MWNKILLLVLDIARQQNKKKSNCGKKVEISDEFGFSAIFASVAKAAKKCEFSNPSVLKYALDHGNSSIRRRCDKKLFYIREI